MTEYPDISDILARKAEGRRDLAKLDFWERVRRMEALRERVRPLKEARERERAAREARRAAREHPRKLNQSLSKHPSKPRGLC